MDRKKAADLAYAEGYRLGSASRDAEVARLKTVPMRYRRMAFNAQLQDEIARLEEERDQFEQVRDQLRAEIAELEGKNYLNSNALRLQKEKNDQLRAQINVLREAMKGRL